MPSHRSPISTPDAVQYQGQRYGASHRSSLEKHRITPHRTGEMAPWGESYAQVRGVTSRVHNATIRQGRPTPRFSLSVRPIVAPTEKQAWEKAEEILARATTLQDKTGYREPADGHATADAQRRLSLADQGSQIDKRLWPRSQNSPAPTATPPRWSRRPSRSPKSSATITT